MNKFTNVSKQLTRENYMEKKLKMVKKSAIVCELQDFRLIEVKPYCVDSFQKEMM